MTGGLAWEEVMGVIEVMEEMEVMLLPGHTGMARMANARMDKSRCQIKKMKFREEKALIVQVLRFFKRHNVFKTLFIIMG